MKLPLLYMIVLTVTAADFKTGLDAYQRGDFATARAEWTPLAEAGDAHAQYNLGLLLARGQGVEQNHTEAAKWYEKAASQGVPAAQYNLGVMYANGQGVAANPEQAAKWFLKAAEQGVTDAQTGLGSIYHEGEGAFRNYAEAAKWYRKAAQEGMASAAFQLGVMYDLGQGVPRDYVEAQNWYQKAAEGGYPAAMANLGILYYNGQGVKRDLVQAYAWFDRAQRLGDPRAGELLGATTRKMKPGDVKKAQSLSAQWTPPSQERKQVADARLFKPQSAEAERAAPVAGEAKNASAAAFSGVARIVAVGDLHGDYEQFTSVLASAGLIDGNGDWVGGKAHLVQTGDVVDRGPDSKPILELLIKLEKQAASAGGAVHALIGNHEAMNVYGDLRYVSPGEFASYAQGRGAEEQFSYAERAALTESAKPSSPAAVPVTGLAGFAEHRAAFAPDGVFGRWIRSRNVAVKIDRTLFVHAGIGPKYAGWSIDRINEEARRELNDFTRLHGGVVTDEEGPLWYRGLATGDEARMAPLVDDLLKAFDVDRIVVGHTYAQAAITPRFGGKVVLIDIGLSRVYDNVGKLGCLEIDGERVTAIHRGQKLELPKDDRGPEMLRYLKQAAALDPRPSPLEKRIEEIQVQR